MKSKIKYVTETLIHQNHFQHFQHFTFCCCACWSHKYRLSCRKSKFNVRYLNRTETTVNIFQVMALMRFFPANTIADRRLLIDTMQQNLDFYWTNFVEIYDWYGVHESKKNK